MNHHDMDGMQMTDQPHAASVYPTTPPPMLGIHEFASTTQVTSDEIVGRFCRIVSIINNKIERARMTRTFPIDPAFIIEDHETLRAVGQHMFAHFGGGQIKLSLYKDTPEGLRIVNQWADLAVAPQEYFDIIKPVMEEARRRKPLADLSSLQRALPDVNAGAPHPAANGGNPFALTPQVLSDLKGIQVNFPQAPGDSHDMCSLPRPIRVEAIQHMYAVARFWNLTLQKVYHKAGYSIKMLISFILDHERETATFATRPTSQVPHGTDAGQLLATYRQMIWEALNSLKGCQAKGFEELIEAFITRRARVWEAEYMARNEEEHRKAWMKADEDAKEAQRREKQKRDDKEFAREFRLKVKLG
ncbi:hypothetical protein CC80DRAFT_592579 [Byssothecium circinans]|uniref:Uncharacterized protein n=1 Tax=Byssothecium circinans TaxID=147558 RepID=A0A6A5TXC9_9PLEO|nr:hypothetical protein CC80DRAFT_592579 [Byssothecium circinans]